MPARIGKPGTRRITGRLRAQFQEIASNCNSVLNYEVIQAGKSNAFLTLAQVTKLADAQAVALALIALRN